MTDTTTDILDEIGALALERGWSTAEVAAAFAVGLGALVRVHGHDTAQIRQLMATIGEAAERAPAPMRGKPVWQ